MSASSHKVVEALLTLGNANTDEIKDAWATLADGKWERRDAGAAAKIAAQVGGWLVALAGIIGTFVTSQQTQADVHEVKAEVEELQAVSPHHVGPATR